MPQHRALNEDRVAMMGVDLGGSLAALAVVPIGARLTDSSWSDIEATLRQGRESPGIIVVFGDHWFAKLFAEVWSTLPSRLASLAIRPPAASQPVFPCGFEPTPLTQQPPCEIANALPHWSLVRIAKGHTRLIVRTVPIEWTSAEARLHAAELDERDLPELLSVPPRRERDWLFQELRLARLSDLCGTIVSPADATAVAAGLWLLQGDAAESHRLSQSIEDEGRHRCGNYWHAIMHRQEPDYGNSKYWLRRVGRHPIFPELAGRARELIEADGSPTAHRWHSKLGLPGGWDPFAFVDWCEAAVGESDEGQMRLLRRIQFVEMQLLLRASFVAATAP